MDRMLSMLARPSVATLVTFLVGLGLVAGVPVAAHMTARLAISEEIVYSSSQPHTPVSELVRNADAIALVRPSGTDTVHWNSSDGRRWQSDDPTRPAYIYRDEPVEVVDVLAGDLPGETVIVRQVGGEADGVRMVRDDDPNWQAGEVYLAFLRLYDTPTQSGTDSQWTILWQERGVFVPDGRDGWVNPRSGESIPANEMEQLIP